MKYEIDLELYTISIVKMNSAFSQLEQNEYDNQAIELLNESVENFNALYQKTLIGLSLREIDFGEYDHFLLNVQTVFPRYINNTVDYMFKVENGELESTLKDLIRLLKNFVKVSEDYFKKRGITT